MARNRQQARAWYAGAVCDGQGQHGDDHEEPHRLGFGPSSPTRPGRFVTVGTGIRRIEGPPTFGTDWIRQAAQRIAARNADRRIWNPNFHGGIVPCSVACLSISTTRLIPHPRILTGGLDADRTNPHTLFSIGNVAFIVPYVTQSITPSGRTTRRTCAAEFLRPDIGGHL